MSSGGRLRAPLRLLAAVMALGCSLATGVTALADAPNDPGFALQWALAGSPSSIHAPQAWCANLGGVLVADVDTGADFGHQDLAGKLVAGAQFLGGNGKQTGSGQAAVQDDQGHGTMTTGLMVADTNNGVGIAGVAPAATALIVKVLKTDPKDPNKASGYGPDVAAGIEYASTYPGVKVINLSIGSDVSPLLGIVNLQSNPILPAIQHAWARGVLVVAASGNNQNNQTDYSSVADQALIAGALARSGAQAGYSSPGSNVDAPGGDAPKDQSGKPQPTVDTSILSTDVGNRYAVGDGTSFAAPMVAGTAAMLSARGLSAPEIRDQILRTESNGTHLNAAAALGRADNGPICPPGSTGSAPPAGSLNIKQSSPPRRVTPATARPAQVVPQVALASPSPSPSPSPLESPTPLQDTMPSPRALAHPPSTPPPSGPAPVAIVAVIAAVGAAGLGGLRLLQLVR